MSNPTQPTGPAAAAADRSAELIDRLLKLPEEVRLDLARLLTDSVREGFTSLAEAGQQDREKIRHRIEAYERGELKASDWREALARVEQCFRAELPK